MEPRFILRPAVINDIPSIMEIEQICFDLDSFSKRQFAYLISQAKGYFYVAEYQQRVGGYFSALINQRACSLRIYSIAIHPLKESLKKIILEVNVSNFPAIYLYEKNGFKCTSVKDNYYHDGSSAYCMQRPVTE